MIAGLPLVFAQPLVLLGLLSLPVLWWLLRLIPPRPRRVDFPPTRMLFDIAPKEETPSRTPWWLTLLRLLLAALVILAAAGPQWNPSIATTGGAAPLDVLIDDGWTSFVGARSAGPGAALLRPVQRHVTFARRCTRRGTSTCRALMRTWGLPFRTAGAR